MRNNFSFSFTIEQVITKHRISHQRYDCIVNRIQKGGTTIDFDSDPTHRRSKSVRTSVQDDTSSAVGDVGVRKFVVSANNLQKVSIKSLLSIVIKPDARI